MNWKEPHSQYVGKWLRSVDRYTKSRPSEKTRENPHTWYVLGIIGDYDNPDATHLHAILLDPVRYKVRRGQHKLQVIFTSGDDGDKYIFYSVIKPTEAMLHKAILEVFEQLIFYRA